MSIMWARLSYLCMLLHPRVGCGKMLRFDFPAVVSEYGLLYEAQGGKPASADILEKDVGLTPDMQEQIVDDLRKFLAAQPDKTASLVLIGDSSVRGLFDVLTNLTDVSHVYQGAYLTASHSEKYGTDVIASDFARGAADNARAAYSYFKDASCSLRGALGSYVLSGDLEGLVVHFYTFLPEINDACWKPCMTEMVGKLKPTAVMWNVGLHLLSSHYDSVHCAVEHGKVHGKAKCGHYEDLIVEGGVALSGIAQHLVWRTTNWACWDKLGSKPDWHNSSALPALEEACRKECPEGPMFIGEQCSDWLLDTHGTRLQRDRSRKALSRLEEKGIHVHTLDAYQLSHKNCDATPDGIHYRLLDGALAQELASLLANATSD